MLTGDKPHDGDSPAVVLYKHLHEDVPPPSAAVPGHGVRAGRAGRLGDRPHPGRPPVRRGGAARAGPRRRGRLSEDQLDAVPPQALAVGTRQRRRPYDVIPRALTMPRPLPVNEDDEASGAALDRTSRFASPPPPPTRRRGEGSRRGPAAIVVAVLLVLGARRRHLVHQLRPVHRGPAAAGEDPGAGRGPAGGRRSGARQGRSTPTATPWSAAQIISTDPTAGHAHPRQRRGGAHRLRRARRPCGCPTLAGRKLDKARSLLKEAGWSRAWSPGSSATTCRRAR